MRKVWKFGSRWSDWGDPNARIANSVFYKYNIAFANTHAVLDVRAGHLIALADGYRIVAIGEVLSAANEIEKLGIVFTKDERKLYFNEPEIPYDANDNDSNICGCHVRYYWLDSDNQFYYYKAGRFFHATGIEDDVNALFDKIK